MSNKRLSTWICFAILMFYAMVLTAIGPLLTEISRSFGLNMTQAGFLFTVNFAGFSVFILFGGIAADQWGKKPVLAVALGASTLCLLMFPLSPGFFVACVATFFIGGCSGIVESIANALIADLNADRPGFYVNLAQIFFGLGALLGPVLIGLGLSAGIGWQTDYMILSGIFLLLTVVFLLNRLPDLPPSNKISLSFMRNLLTDRKFLLFCLCMLLYTGSEVGAWGWMSTFMQQEFAFNPVQSSLAVGIFWAAIIVGRFICTIANLKVSTKLLVIILAYASAVVTVLSGLVKSELEIWIVVVALGLAFSGQWSLIVTHGSSHYKQYSGTIFAAYVGSGGVGMALIPFVMGVVGQYAGLRASMVSTAVFFIGIGVIFMFIDKLKFNEERQ